MGRGIGGAHPTCSELKWNVTHAMHVRTVSFSIKWTKFEIIGLSDSFVIREMYVLPTALLLTAINSYATDM